MFVEGRCGGMHVLENEVGIGAHRISKVLFVRIQIVISYYIF